MLIEKSVDISIIPKGQTQIKITNPLVSKDSRIFITPTISTKGTQPYISDVKEGSSFTIRIEDYLEDNISLNWWIIN